LLRRASTAITVVVFALAPAGCTSRDASAERGSRAVGACRRQGGVSAFDDDIVICRDQTVHEAVER
jgi:hypothetical protein